MDLLTKRRKMAKVIAVYMLYEAACGPQRDIWVHELLQDRDKTSEFILAEEILTGDDEDKCIQYLRMSNQQFHFVLSLVDPLIKKKDTFWRRAITARQRLIVTLRYLATGSTQIHIAFSFRVGHTTMGVILRETLEALWITLQPLVLPPPSAAKWLEIARDFGSIWQLPNCIGSLDGKHVRIKAPAKSGSEFFNYKGYFSVVLMAICDAHYRFILVDIGNSGRHSDGGVFAHSRIGQAFGKSALDIPPPIPLPGTSSSIPLFFAADAAFPMLVGILKPFSGRTLAEDQRIFNYRLSRGRRTVENAFGILAARWHVFFKPIAGSIDLSEKIIKGCVVLHNFLQAPQARCPVYGDQITRSGTVIDGNWRQNIPPSLNLISLSNSRANNYSRNAGEMREKLKRYFMTDGAVPWQWQSAYA